MIDHTDILYQLDEEQLKEKKKQKLMKAGFDARERARKEKERERGEREAEEKREEDEREQNLEGWAGRLRREHAVSSALYWYIRLARMLNARSQAIMTKIKDRNRRKAALTDRKSAASQARMKNIAHLAADERMPKKRRKGNGGAS